MSEFRLCVLAALSDLVQPRKRFFVRLPVRRPCFQTVPARRDCRSISAPDFQTRKKLPVVAVGEKERKPAGSWISIVGQTRSSNEPSARWAEAGEHDLDWSARRHHRVSLQPGTSGSRHEECPGCLHPGQGLEPAPMFALYSGRVTSFRLFSSESCAQR